jgi:plasmid stabilization system protein ParE
VARVRYSDQAFADLDRIIEFLLGQSVEAGEAALGRIEEAVALLERHPRVGRRVARELRELVISHGSSGYLALYRYDVAADFVLVMRIRHQREAGYRD